MALTGICEILLRQTHHDFKHYKTSTIVRRIQRRMQVLQMTSVDAYVERLQTHGEEVIALFKELLINVTCFFRDPDAFDALKTEVIAKCLRQVKPEQKFRVWVAGCSTGEEVYTIAMLILESQLFSGWDVRVFGSDVSRRALKQARAAEYGASSFRVLDEARARRWFEPAGEKRRVRDEARALCRFGQVNLVDLDATAVLGEFDVAFCRNVLIYFDAASRRKVIATLERKLQPGGYLLLGHSESLAGLSAGFELVHLPGDMVYRRPASHGAGDGA